MADIRFREFGNGATWVDFSQIEEAFNDGYEDMRAQIPRIKNETIERCAQIIESLYGLNDPHGKTFAAAIRALKDH